MSNPGAATFHLFRHRGVHCLIDVEGMRTQRLSGRAARTLLGLGGTGEPSAVRRLLSQLGVHEPAGPPPSPIRRALPVTNIALFVTHACNLRCRYCYAGAGETETGPAMSRATALAAIDWLMKGAGDARVLRIGFMGGEPLLRLGLIKGAVAHAQTQARAHDKRVLFYTSTNGTTLSRGVVEFLARHRFSVQVSIDGPAELHDAQRPFKDGRGSFSAIAPGARRLLGAIPDASAHAVLYRDLDPQPIRDTLLAMGFKNISELPASPPVSGPDASGPRKGQQSILSRMERDAEAWLRAVREGSLPTLARLAATTGLYAPLRMLLHGIKSHFPCGAGLGLVGVGADGGLYPCQRFVGRTSHRIGMLDHRSVRADAFRDSPIHTIEACRDCFAKYYCAGGCRYDHAASNDSPQRPAAWMCQYRRRQFELAAYVISGLGEAQRRLLADQRILPPKPCPLDF